MEIRGARVLVTGASGGLGHAIARDLAGRGAELVLTARRTAVIEALAEELGAETVTADLTDRADVERLAGLAAEADVLVANAGIGADKGVEEVEPADVDASIDVNLRAPILLATAFVQGHRASGAAGHVVMIGSLSGLAPSPGTNMYNATKFGLRGFALSLRQDLHGSPVGLSIVEPGFIRGAGMFHDGDIDLPPGVRTSTPDDVARGVARAIERDVAEVFVAPPEMRVASTLASVAPGLTAAVMRKVDAGGRVKGPTSS
ncbi:MAG TPA: SDR family NAD(P)-dependent oxidoreductase [Acidimicrobiales bacterium]|nr:SDR family NAD(P)-dependent oxidoreductase [Acidimicrobiales bacterium]